ncbi:MAG TPA: hypothetical protein VKQ52_06945 [Puia sp.]|nr:hypothetical protein [Puia sp.]
MPITITVKDETTGGRIFNETPITFENELTTVKAIIVARVTAEVEAYNTGLPEYYKGLVQPSDAENTLNGYRLKARRQIDPEQQCAVALDAFKKNGYFVLIDNIQAESLDQMVVINSDTNISFVKLTPLIGG